MKDPTDAPDGEQGIAEVGHRIHVRDLCAQHHSTVRHDAEGCQHVVPPARHRGGQWTNLQYLVVRRMATHPSPERAQRAGSWRTPIK